MIKKMLWLWICFWGKKYYITYTDKLKKDEILLFSHRIYLKNKKNEINKESG